MLSNDTRSKIKDITAGIIITWSADPGATIRNILCRSYPTSKTVKKEFESKAIIKEKQATELEQYATEMNLWVPAPSEERFLDRGGESRVYLDVGNKHVIKLNDAIYYATWLEFFNSIVLHNLIFQNTAYNLLGFTKEENTLHAVLKQPFITSDAQVDLEDIKKFLVYNEFQNSKRNDYVHKALGLILEDMHDENVLVNSDTLFFIDTVFYTFAPEHI